MTSSTTGERRWGSTKRGGMTVLGKVAVPKPINLPSQRLENHGLDPNVEIVPKGSLSWGTRPSSSGSNAWSSSSVLSPRTEGGSASSSHLSGRPSSSGGGTRPSTADSERNPDTASSSWTANSRPSSASGILASNNTSMAVLRPRSAETRPGSSQLSRFAEPLSEGAVTLGASGAADKLGVAAPSSDGFSLSSGDFPTLGSEKVSGNIMESSDHSSHDHPGSSGPSATPIEKKEAAPGDDNSHSTDAKSNMVNSWENDAPHPGMERWHGDSYPYPNHNIHPHPYDTWRGGPPLNPPGGVWFRGPPGAPYGTPPLTAPGGFPMEPFPYYCPQVPAPGLANSQTVPPHGAAPTGPQSKNGDLCRPFMESYIRPGMPIRPGFYPGYYGQPMGFCNPNERDFSLMGMPTGPPVFNKYPNHNQNSTEPNTSNARSCGGRTLEQVESGPPLDSRSSFPVKQIKGWDKNNKEIPFVHKTPANAHLHDKGGHAANASSQGNFWSEDPRKEKQMNRGEKYLQSEDASSFPTDDKTGSTDPAFVKRHGNNNRAESANMNHTVEDVALPRDRTLIQKIEGLNAKVRATDGMHDFCREEPYGRGQVVSSHVNFERHHPSVMLVPVSDDKSILAKDKDFGSTVGGVVTTISRHSSHNLQGRGDHGSKGRINSQEADGWRKRSATSESRGIASAVNSGRTTNIQQKQQLPAILHKGMSSSDGDAKDNIKLPTPAPSDSQHDRNREITKQRAIQLQKEEEERIREQKAKAFAKLEELNRRSVSRHKETSRQKMDDLPSQVDGVQQQKQSKIKIELQFGSFQSGEIGSAVASGYNPSQISQGSESLVSLEAVHTQTIQNLHQKDPLLLQKQPLPAIDDAHINDVAGHQNVFVSETSRQQGAGYKQKQNVHAGKMTPKAIVDGQGKRRAGTAVLKGFDEKGVSSSSESNLPVKSPTFSDSLLHPKGKNYRAGKSKYTVDEPLSVSSASVPKEFDGSRTVTESMKLDSIKHKSYSNDAVVWAPVKSHTKTDVVDGNDRKAVENAAPSHRNGNAVASGSKSRRAEIERYVPKAAIKELAQQESDQLSVSPSTGKSIPDGSSILGPVSSQTTERTKRHVEYRHVESKTKQIQTHGSLHQHISTESNFVHVSGDDSLSVMGPTKNSQTSGVHQTRKPKELLKGSVVKPIAQLVEVLPSKQDEGRGKQQVHPQEVNEDNAVDGWVIYDEPVSSGSSILSGVESHEKSTRGKHNPFKGHRESRNHQSNIDHESRTGANDDAEYFSEISQAERPRSSKEHHAAQWQPKPHTHVPNQHGNHSRGRQSVTGEADKIFKREGANDASSQLKQQIQDTAKNTVQQLQPQIYSAGSNAAPKDSAYSPNVNAVGDVETAPLDHTDGINNDQRTSSSGNRWNGNYNGRSNRGREFRGDRSFTSQENRQNYVPANRERQRQNSRYEYQPVGPYSGNQRDNSGAQTENQHTGAKFSSRGQGSHSQRGRGGASFRGWQRVTNQTDVGPE